MAAASELTQEQLQGVLREFKHIGAQAVDKEYISDARDKREIGDEAVWSLSSAKAGNGVEQLRDNNEETFWQSDGAAPHLINIQFQRKMKIKELAMCMDHKLDESYTPLKLLVRVGTSFHDLRDIHAVELDEPRGWIRIPLEEKAEDGTPRMVRAYMVQIAIVSSHQNGRDTHVRQVKVFGPRTQETKGMGTDLSTFSCVEFSQFATLR